MTDSAPCPLVFRPILKEKVWGGRRLADLGKTLPSAGAAYGESWELADLARTSASGGGGDAAVSEIVSGPLAGKTIGDAIGLWGERLLGAAGLRRAMELGELTGAGRPVFPLLIKFLDAREHLSVQVHPSPEHAARNADAHLKTESWYVLHAEPTEAPATAGGGRTEPVIFKGVRPEVTRERFERDIREGRVADDLVSEPARAGACYTLPSGTCHALGAGVLVAEVQTPSDTTYRVYDWQKEFGRAERELHIERALECIGFGSSAAAGPEARRPPDPAGGRVAETDFYTIDVVSDEWSVAPRDQAIVLIITDGSGRVSALGARMNEEGRTDAFDPIEVTPGSTVLIPANCGARLTGVSLRALEVRVGG